MCVFFFFALFISLQPHPGTAITPLNVSVGHQSSAIAQGENTRGVGGGVAIRQTRICLNLAIHIGGHE